MLSVRSFPVKARLAIQFNKKEQRKEKERIKTRRTQDESR
jgi:hypothetical protein